MGDGMGTHVLCLARIIPDNKANPTKVDEDVAVPFFGFTGTSLPCDRRGFHL
jgi:hypothetical protein